MRRPGTAQVTAGQQDWGAPSYVPSSSAIPATCAQSQFIVSYHQIIQGQSAGPPEKKSPNIIQSGIVNFNFKASCFLFFVVVFLNRKRQQGQLMMGMKMLKLMNMFRPEHFPMAEPIKP